MYTTVEFIQPALAFLAQMRSTWNAAGSFQGSGNHAEAHYFQNSLAQVEWHPMGYVYVLWKDNPPCSTEFRAVFRYVRALLNLTNCTMLLADQRALQPPSESDITWLVEEWTPAAVRETGYSHRAVVCADNLLTQQRMTTVIETGADEALTTECFADVEAAVRWLRSIYV